MDSGNATIAIDGRLIVDATDPPRIVDPGGAPVRSAVAVAVISGDDWEIGSGLLRGTVGEKRPDGSRVETLSIQRISVVKSSRGGKSLDLQAGESVQLHWIVDGGHFTPLVAQLQAAVEATIAGGE